MTILTPAQKLASRALAEVADLVDLQLSPLGIAAIDALAPSAGETIVDIGCGAGQTLGQLASLVGPTGRVIGVDISAELLALAASRTAGWPQVTLIAHDATTLALPDGGADGVYSRFGVMAFPDPAAAFSNFHRMLRKGGRLAFACWRSLEENELDTLPLRAAGLEDRVDRTPFSFEDPDYAVALLKAAGFDRIAIEPLDAEISCGDVAATLKVVTRVGALGRILREAPALRADAEPRVRAAHEARGPEVRLGVAIWVISAVRPA
jgi:SAM-dependent methyltransferase